MKIQSVLQKHEDKIMQIPNVVGIGIGKKGDAEVIKVFVTHKVPESALKANQIIPKGLEGYETDVEEIGLVTSQI
ncbi:hypothetical protein [Methylomicrobium sp. Wu6]|uniref:hypothetical protein n=1 Tax=Methylomicrobium sp. Wu6 TaxID=3107928 RepID=UPI002DD6947A|nr:hypothetical protein [Methylomicrobium sp. Wu6]MEC4748874.1 hypothetical protein [Methylomicrobium sp. Wu6]